MARSSVRTRVKGISQGVVEEFPAFPLRTGGPAGRCFLQVFIRQAQAISWSGTSPGSDHPVLGRIVQMRRFRSCAIAKPRRHKPRGTVLRVPDGTAGPRGREGRPGPSMASANHSSLCISAASRSRSDMPGTISLLSFANRKANPPRSASPRPIAGSSRSPQRAAGCDPRLPARTRNHHENHSQDCSQLVALRQRWRDTIELH